MGGYARNTISQSSLLEKYLLSWIMRLHQDYDHCYNRRTSWYINPPVYVSCAQLLKKE